MSVFDKVIVLAPMQQLAESKGEADDLTGLSDAAARRKKQNRLNQRAHRRRKAVEARLAGGSGSDLEVARYQQSNTQWQNSDDILRLTTEGQQLLALSIETIQGSLKDCGLDPTMATTKYRDMFPLSADHLIPLIQFNVLRGILSNMALMSLLHTVPLECASVLNIPPIPTPATTPPALTPTHLQRASEHSYWIDIIPYATIRDNFIRAAGTYDEDEMCSDFIGGLFEGCSDCDSRGWVVWGDPWDPSGWEVTEGFAKKWGFLLRGCNELVEATNRWRAARGEENLVVEIE